MTSFKSKSLAMHLFYIFLLFPFRVALNIRNADIPSCKNCIHYEPNTFISSLNKCKNFGEKNIITNKINYDYADHCRNNEDKCGKSGKNWQLEPNIYLKIFMFSLIHIFSLCVYLFCILYIILYIF
jgi:hypothetical protein